ncbi:21885_t:CDS:10 [Dentiscutata erythropus]|uniref:21885_t:CDS:1 n=1 Tax=Dentiscutata erythropus TaxID=1348616 RepID=A0A9N9F0W4_9GLOM|nr:21885_t:CDS:10 [Dentiscutata erythropus]
MADSQESFTTFTTLTIKMPEIPEVRCDCGNTLYRMVSNTYRNPNRAFYKCDDCKFWEWEDELAKTSKALRDTKSLISTSREMPNLMTSQKLTQNLTNGHFTNLDEDIFQESRAPPIPTLITSQNAPQKNLVNPINFGDTIGSSSGNNAVLTTSSTSKLNLTIGSLEKENLNLNEQLNKLNDERNSGSRLETGSDEYKKMLILERENLDLKKQLNEIKQENSQLKNGAQLEESVSPRDVNPWICEIILNNHILGYGFGAASLLLCESLSAQPKNEKFQKKIEFTRLASTLITNTYQRRFIQFVLFVTFQSLVISSIIISAQTMDSLTISMFGKTCGIGIYPTKGFFCVSEQSGTGSPFGNSYMLLTSGYLITLVAVVPLGVMELVDNIKVQIASFIMLIFIIATWIVTFIVHGLQSNLVPFVGNDQSQVVGTVLYNYVFVTTVPSWVNEASNVPIRKAVWYSVFISTIAYISLGVFGGMSYTMNTTSNIIAVINKSNERTVISLITTYLFPVAALITSVPVYTIIVRLNLVNHNNYSKRFWLNSFMNWTSLIFSTISNFILPFWLYYLTKTQKHVKNDDDLVKSGISTPIKLERNQSTISDIISIKSIRLTDEHPFPIVISPPSPGLWPIDNNSCDSIHHLSPHSPTPSSPRRRRSRSPSRSRSLSRSSSKVGIDSIEVHQVHFPENHIDVIVINTDALSNHQKLTDSPTFLNVPLPQLDTGNENRDRDLSCLPPGHTTSVATESDTRGYLSAPPSLVARTTFSRRKSPSRPTIVTTPTITINDESCDNDLNDNLQHNLSIHSCHSSVTCPPSPVSAYEEKMSSSFNESERVVYAETFKAFPILTPKHGIWIAKFGGTLAILMAFGVLTYDF